eukprot:TRINITY_DN11762_c1_g1_i1.p1 TRINITY_DN11762_c1_g1~~TRINITY_DN11762_c1_g1_i1.p1  ORF type:complete len:146 (+),score=23.20 TRINITY_DN11762_c1_g1_i1:43-438(+)
MISDPELRKESVRAKRFSDREAKWVHQSDGLEKRKARNWKWTDKAITNSEFRNDPMSFVTKQVDKMPSRYYKTRKPNNYSACFTTGNFGKMKPTRGGASRYHASPQQQHNLLTARRAVLEKNNTRDIDFYY